MPTRLYSNRQYQLLHPYYCANVVGDSVSAILVASYAYVQALDIHLPGLGYG